MLYTLTLKPAQTGLSHYISLAKREAKTKHGPRIRLDSAWPSLAAPIAVFTVKTNGSADVVSGKLTSKNTKDLAETLKWIEDNAAAIKEHWLGKVHFTAQNSSTRFIAKSASPRSVKGKKPAAHRVVAKLRTFVGISRDHSGSMRPLADGAMRDYNAQISAIKESVTSEGQESSVTVALCGVHGPGGAYEVAVHNAPIEMIQPITSYPTNGTSTPLFDSVGALIESMQKAPGSGERDASFLVMAITDGEDNNSPRWPAHILKDTIVRLQATDKWTFVFRVPKGYGSSLERRLGVPGGNILEWEQTDKGFAAAETTNRAAIKRFFTGRASGRTGTRSFYTDVADISAHDMARNMADISASVKVNTVRESIDVSDFSVKYLGRPLQKGTLFYQLEKREPKVQDYKHICIRDKQSGQVFGGTKARDLIGLPKSGTHSVIPGDHGRWDIFVQSTSLNRKLPAGTKVLYWSDANKF